MTSRASSSANAARPSGRSRSSASIDERRDLAAAGQPPDLAHEPRADRDQVAGGQPVGRAGRVGGGRAERGRRDHVRGRGGHEQPLGQAAPAALLRDRHEAVGLERAQVVVDLLAGQPDPAGERRGRRRLGELGQQPRPHRVQRDDRGGGVLDHLDVQHASIEALTNILSSPMASFGLGRGTRRSAGGRGATSSDWAP